MSKKRWLTHGSVLHPRHERPGRSGGGMVDRVAVSSGGRASSQKKGPNRHTSQQTLAVEDAPRKDGVSVSPIERSSDTGLTTAGRFRVTK